MEDPNRGPSPPTGKTPVPSWMKPPPPQDDDSYPSWMKPPPPQEDDSWLDEEIAKEEDEIMKHIMIEAKRSMRRLSNEAKRKYISDERKRIIELKQYANDIDTTQGFEVGTCPYMLRKSCGGMITSYYCPPEITVTDYQIANLTRLASEAIQHFNSEHGKEYTNVTVCKAMRSFSCGFCYYLTFQASLPDGESPQTFEAKVYEHPPLPTSYIKIDFVRLKNVN